MPTIAMIPLVQVPTSMTEFDVSFLLKDLCVANNVGAVKSVSQINAIKLRV